MRHWTRSDSLRTAPAASAGKRHAICTLFQVWILVAMIAGSGKALGQAASSDGIRVTIPFDGDWRFLKSDPVGAERIEFDDAQWRTLSVPHDWSIEGPFDASNPTGPAGGFLPAGIGWYRKHFALPQDYAGRRVFIDFDGVMANSDVWINGFHLGNRPYGYVSFRYELTGHLVFGGRQANVIAVRVDDSGQPASRWYSGAGIYRHVRLVVTNAVHLDHYASFITTPAITSSQATVRVQTVVVNQSGVSRKAALRVMLVGPDKRLVRTVTSKQQTLASRQSASFQVELAVHSPLIWDTEHPYLYRAMIRVQSGNKILDDENIAFGIREFRFDPATGFWLNGRNMKIKGVCLHHDASALGAAVPLRAWERRLETLKQLEVNAIRTAHNPPAPEFLDLADRMGFLVMDEMFDAWTLAKNPYDYHLHFRDWFMRDAGDTVQRDRNHPSVVIYSAGNEIRDTTNAELAKQILSSLLGVFHKFDPSRPVTQALFRPNVSHDYDDGLADLLDVVGQNYRENEILAAHQARPSRKILGTENGHDHKAWLALRDNAAYAGQFLWSGIDYLGEAHQWPMVAAGSGLLDRTATPRPLAFQRQSWWSERPMVYIARRVAPSQVAPTDPGYEALPQRRVQVLFSDWNPPNNTPHDEDVEVYSNCEKVELFLNGKSLGSQPRPADDAPRTWTISFAPGTLKAVGTNHGKIEAIHELRTAGSPARILLSADHQKITPTWDDVSYVEATIVDENGVLVRGASDLVSFELSGPGMIVAVDSGDNASHESFQATERHAFQGHCFAILRASGSSGPIIVNASASGLAGSTLTIVTVPPPAGDQ
jgi:beta-galactosidase